MVFISGYANTESVFCGINVSSMARKELTFNAGESSGGYINADDAIAFCLNS